VKLNLERGRVHLREFMDTCDIAPYANTLIGKLSKGYRQRAGLAQALVHDPQVLVLDEPTIGLDPKQIREVRQLIKGLSGDHPIILSTHILPEAEQVCERVVIIPEGKIVADDSAEILTAELERTQRLFIHLHSLAPDAVRVLSRLEGVTDVKDRAMANSRFPAKWVPIAVRRYLPSRSKAAGVYSN
jgi:ABC-2 type transport system ATP-binding protein